MRWIDFKYRILDVFRGYRYRHSKKALDIYAEIEIMGRTIELIFTKTPEGLTCIACAGWNEINIDMDKIIYGAKSSGIPFDELYAHVISHEIIHIILDKLVDPITSVQLDLICKKDWDELIGGI